MGSKNKSIILKKYLHSCFNRDYSNVIGCNIYIKEEMLEYDELTFSIWDISANERFRFFRTSFYHGSCAILLFFEMNKMDDINNLPNWIIEARNILGPVPTFLIGYTLDDAEISAAMNDRIDEICNLYHSIYYEINRDDLNLDNLFQQIGNLSLDYFGYTLEKRREMNLEIKKQNEKFKEVLTELGFNIKNNKRIEILTAKGLFNINIFTGKVSYDHYICEKCDKNKTCKEKLKNYHVKKSLCIIRKDDPGWSNILNQNQLLILSKIYAILEDKLPKHVINQMISSIHCDYGKEVFLKIITQDPVSNNTKSNKSIFKKSSITINSIKTKLRNIEFQFWNGFIPACIYFKLKDKYEKMLEDSS
ncbi:MAG: hypothetical protein ACTSQO_01495 [Candidatus Helarchaeota archaeon]